VAIVAATIVKELPLKRLLPTFADRVATSAVLIPVVFGVVAAINVQRYFVTPQEKELEITRDLVASTTPEPTVHVRRCHLTQTLAPLTQHDEFGLPSCSQAYVVEREIRWLYAEHWDTSPSVEVVDPGQPLPAGAQIDLAAAMTRLLSVATNPQLVVLDLHGEPEPFVQRS
jgi:hypothetical protein